MTAISPHENSTTMFAIGKLMTGETRYVMRFESPQSKEVNIIGKIKGNDGTRTAFFKGSIFVIGGYNPDFEKRVSTFDVTTLKYDQIADLQIRRLCGHSIATSPDEIFVCGGWSEYERKCCEAFHPHTYRWRRLPDMQQGRRFGAVAFLPDGRLMTTGGLGTKVVSSCEILVTTSQSDSWRLVAEMRHARWYHAAVFHGGCVLVAGGLETSSSEVFMPPSLGSNTEIGQWTSLSDMTRSLENVISLVPISANEIIAFNHEGEIERFMPEPTSEVYDFKTWSWTPLPRVIDFYEVNGLHCAN